MSTVVDAPKPVHTPGVPSAGIAFHAAWALLAGAALVLLWVLWRVWMSLPEMNDRFLIPLAAAWLVQRNLPRWRAAPFRPAPAGFFLVGLGALLTPPAWFLLVQVGPRVLLLWWLTGALALSAFGLCAAQFGWRRAWINAFPIAFCFLALPTPDRLQTPLQMQLKEYTTSASAAALPAVGIPAERRGHTLVLSSGTLGVVDACSGVRSVTALTAIALFVAYVRGFSIGRGAVLVVVTLGIVVVSNSLRVIVTGILQEKISPQFAHGWAHDVLGYLVILIGLVLIVCASSMLARPLSANSDTLVPTGPGPAPRGGAVAFTLVALSLAGCIWAEKFRPTEGDQVNLDLLPSIIAGWQGSDRKVPEGVADVLKCDQLLHRAYIDDLGQEIEIYVMYWATPASTAHMHHPDNCMPLQGWTVDSSRVWPVEYRAGRSALPVSMRTYSLNGRRQLVLYWTQAGTDVLPDGQEDTRQVQEYKWVRDMLTGRATPAHTSRLSVRIDMELHGDVDRQLNVMTSFTGALAREVYTLLPWATPTQ